MRIVPTLIIVITLMILGIVLERLSLNHHNQQQRVDVLEQLSLLRAKLEGSLSSNLHLLSGMSAAIATNPNISTDQFNRLAAKLMENRHDLRNITAAPELVIRYIYPLQGNQAALGLDYTRHEQQRAAALQARDLNSMVVAGPLKLAQGGTGLIARSPVYYLDRQGEPIFWGIVSSVLDSEKLFQTAGIYAPTLNIELAIRGKDSKGPQGDIFFGKPELFNAHAVTQAVSLPHGSWQLAAVPKGGWQTASPYRWPILSGCLIVAITMLWIVKQRARKLEHERLSQITFFQAFAESPLGVAISDPGNDEITDINRSLCAMSRIADSADGSPKSDAKRLPTSVLKLIRGSQTSHSQEVIISDNADNERTWRCFRSEILTPSGTRWLTQFQDITENADLNKQLELSKQVINHTSDAVVITDSNSIIIEVNTAFSQITGYSREESIGKKPSLYQSNHHEAEFYRQMWQQVNDKGEFNGEIWNRSKSGGIFPARVSINRIGELDDAGHLYIGVFSDISNIKQAEQELERLAYYDPLTALPNRALFQDRLLHEITSCRRYNHRLALLFIDLDRFKHVNDSFGHSVGDQLLKIIAERLVSQVRENDTVTRLGGDEFTIIVSELGNIGRLTTLIERLLQCIQAPIPLVGQQLHVGASIGIAIYPNDGEDAEILLQHADMAMYQAKEHGRNQFNYFTAQLQERASSRLMLENQIRTGIEQQQFVLYYQPKLELHSRRVLGMEALVRWIHPDSGMIMPNDFIPVAEESGLIVPLGHWVLEEACRQTQAWHLQGLSHLRVAVNLSARQFAKVDLVDDISRILQQTGLPADALELEITESMVVDDSAAAAKVMHRLRSLGLEISIDDFGTGYSNLQYLKQFPLNSLKIDRGFVRDLTSDREDAAIIKAIILMARGLGLNVIAEGIETLEQLEFLMDQRCPMGQGYLFSKPLAADQFRDWIDGTDLELNLFDNI